MTDSGVCAGAGRRLGRPGAMDGMAMAGVGGQKCRRARHLPRLDCCQAPLFEQRGHRRRGRRQRFLTGPAVRPGTGNRPGRRGVRTINARRTGTLLPGRLDMCAAPRLGNSGRQERSTDQQRRQRRGRGAGNQRRPQHAVRSAKKDGNLYYSYPSAAAHASRNRRASSSRPEVRPPARYFLCTT